MLFIDKRRLPIQIEDLRCPFDIIEIIEVRLIDQGRNQWQTARLQNLVHHCIIGKSADSTREDQIWQHTEAKLMITDEEGSRHQVVCPEIQTSLIR